MARGTTTVEAEPAIGLSTIVLGVYDRILAEILDGTRKAGSTVRDQDVAEEFGVSRTPVREALQLLRMVGLVEVLPSRFTRIAVLGVEDVEQAGSVSLLLYGLVIQEVAAGDAPVPLEEIEAEQAAARAAIDKPSEFFAHCFRLHDLVVQLSPNEHLLRAIDAVVHALRLALITNASAISFEHVLAGQQGIIDGLREHNPGLAHHGIETLRGLGDHLPLPSAG